MLTKRTYLLTTLLLVLLTLSACDAELPIPAQSTPAAETSAIGDYMAASALTRNGFAIDGEQMRSLDGQMVKLWGFVDHGNMYGDDDARAILEDRWSGEGPSAAAWRFNLKSQVDDAVGQSFAVHVPNDAGRDELLRRFVADARAQQPTRVFLTGEITAFDAPTNNGTLTGLILELQSSDDILLTPPDTR